MDDHEDLYKSSAALFTKISDITRIVDPLQKSVIEYKNSDAVLENVHCFDFWKNNKVCDNCISMRAYNDNSTYVKIEYLKDKTYLITAVPYEKDGKRVVIEILKDITNSMLFSSDDSSDTELMGVHALINSMNKLAFSDPLTGLYNRRYIIEKLPVDLLNAAMLSTEVSIIIADIDLFKAVNDNYGHLAGDLTLKIVAEVISGCLKRSSDWIARYGGDEFLISMPGADLETAKAIAESMRKAIERTIIKYEKTEMRITASFGINNIKILGSESVDELLKHADEKLYTAKGNGRNKIVC